MGTFYDVVQIRDDQWALVCAHGDKQEKVAWFTDQQSALTAMKSAQAVADTLAKHDE